MLTVKDLNVYYGPIHAVKGISFEVNDGEIVTLIGANGAGKSTILKTISGLMRPKPGEVDFLGQKISSMPPHRIVKLGIAHVPEGRRIFTKLTVEENLEMGAFVRSRDSIPASKELVFEQFPRLFQTDALFVRNPCQILVLIFLSGDTVAG